MRNLKTKGLNAPRAMVMALFLLLACFAAGRTAVTAEAAMAAAKPTIKMNRDVVTLYTTGSKTFQMKVTVTGKSKKVTWKSSNTKVATVDSKGKVTAKKAGKATVTAKANGKTATCKITVKKASIKLNKSKATIYTSGNKTIQLKATITGKNKKVAWKSSKPSVASVSSNGKVTAKKTGTVTITAKANGVSAKCTVTVKGGKEYIKNALAAYENILKKNVNESGEVIFACYDIDTDGMLELMVSHDEKWNEKWYRTYRVYDYVNGKTVYMGYSINPINHMSRDKKYLISMIGDAIRFYTISDGKLKLYRRYMYHALLDDSSKEMQEWYAAVQYVYENACSATIQWHDGTKNEAIKLLRKMFS